VLTADTAPFPPDEHFTLVPDEKLLFHFSALTFNAHAIHLDPLYARAREGHRGIVVHGPLSLTLMLTLLRARLERDSVGDTPWRLRSLDYRNVAPLYVDEKVKVCLRKSSQKTKSTRKEEEENDVTRWDVWVEGPDGGLAVKGTATAVRSRVNAALLTSKI
jgi:hydroxyacyl-ACP dehydratase HTD2-like protein with hotdog domain